MMSVDVPALIVANQARWDKMHVLPQYAKALQGIKTLMVGAQSRYGAVSATVHIPWYVIAALHEREASMNFSKQLGQGWPLTSRSQIIPHTGPFNTWEDSATSALCNINLPVVGYPPFKWRDWSPGGMLTMCELYNGPGYVMHGVPSPYIWSFTDQYHSGKYVADGKYDPSTVDKQPGVAALIATLGVLNG